MNIEGNTYLFYDKYCGDHGFSNPKTINITLNDLYSGDYITYTDKIAIDKFNEINQTHKLSKDIDTNFYGLTFFEIPNECKKFLCICVNHNNLKICYIIFLTKNF